MHAGRQLLLLRRAGKCAGRSQGLPSKSVMLTALLDWYWALVYRDPCGACLNKFNLARCRSCNGDCIIASSYAVGSASWLLMA